MDNGNIEESLLFTEALRLIINNYLFEIMIYLRMSYFTNHDIATYVRNVGYVEPDGQSPRVIPFLLPLLPVPFKTMLDGLWAGAGGHPAAEAKDKIAPLLYTLVTTMKLINYHIDEVRKSYIDDNKDERDDEQAAFDTLFSGEQHPNMFSDEKVPNVRRKKAKREGKQTVKAAASSRAAKEEGVNRRRADATPRQRSNRADKVAIRRTGAAVPVREPTAANNIIKLALDSLSAAISYNFVDPKIDDTGKQIMLQIVNVWNNVIQMNPIVLEILIDAYGNGPLPLRTQLASTPINYYNILDHVFNNVFQVVKDPTMNMLHLIYNTMINWKFVDPNMVATNNYYEQNRMIYELQLFAAVGYIEFENNMNAPPVATPRSVTELAMRAGVLGGTTKKKKNLKKKKKSTKGKKKRKNNIKSKRKLKLIKKTIKVKN